MDGILFHFIHAAKKRRKLIERHRLLIERSFESQPGSVKGISTTRKHFNLLHYYFLPFHGRHFSAFSALD